MCIPSEIPLARIDAGRVRSTNRTRRCCRRLRFSPQPKKALDIDKPHGKVVAIPEMSICRGARPRSTVVGVTRYAVATPQLTLSGISGQRDFWLLRRHKLSFRPPQAGAFARTIVRTGHACSRTRARYLRRTRKHLAVVLGRPRWHGSASYDMEDLVEVSRYCPYRHFDPFSRSTLLFERGAGWIDIVSET
jgi:hypothetical protein